MENNNRQGCREEAIGFGLFILAGRYERFTDGIFGAWQGKEDRKLYSNDELYTLYKQQSIEPCATSSENYWKQRCEAAEVVIEVIEPKPESQSQWNVYENWKYIKSQTPSPTGDRDCEELKKEVERLKGLMLQAFYKGYGSPIGQSDETWKDFLIENNL